jgi:hypothetical protein
MRILMTIAAAAAALAQIGAAGPVATAATGRSAPPAVHPNPATPGSRIWVSAGGCTSATGTATSPALSAPIALSTDDLSGPGILREDLISGAYPLTLHCGSTLTTTIHVVAAGSAVAAAPYGSADTGADDGSASDHLGIGDAALGSAVVLGGIAFGTVSLMRRRRAAPRD